MSNALSCGDQRSQRNQRLHSRILPRNVSRKKNAKRGLIGSRRVVFDRFQNLLGNVERLAGVAFGRQAGRQHAGEGIGIARRNVIGVKSVVVIQTERRPSLHVQSRASVPGFRS